jgi:adenosine tuberculosinyltransferase
MTISIQEWMSLPDKELKKLVTPRKLSVLMQMDGTRRHYMLNHPDKIHEVADFADYARHTSAQMVKVFSLMYSLGVENILFLALIPGNFTRPNEFLKNALEQSSQVFVNDPFTSMYQEHGVQARLFGDFDISPKAEIARDVLVNLEQKLEEITPEGDNRLLLGYYAGSFADELALRSVMLKEQTGQMPTEADLRRSCFPHGPEKLDIFLGAGWMRIGLITPPILDGGNTDIYTLSHLTLDLDEETLRRILYDHIYVRLLPDDDLSYQPEHLDELRDFYEKQHGKLVGLGQLVGPGIWHPVCP